MNPFDLLGWFLPMSSAFVAVAVLLLVLVMERPRPAPIVRLPNGSWRPVGAPGAPDSVWNAVVYPAGPTSGQHGTLVVSAGNLSFIPEGAQSPAWWAPVRSLRAVTRPSLFRLVNIDLDLWFGNGATVGVVVSRSRINRFVANSLKYATQAQSAREFCAILYAQGALAIPPQPGRQMLR